MEWTAERSRAVSNAVQTAILNGDSKSAVDILIELTPEQLCFIICYMAGSINALVEQNLRLNGVTDEDMTEMRQRWMLRMYLDTEA